MSAPKFLVILAAIGTMSLLATAPAEAGRRTGSWKYSPEEIDAMQQAQREAAWRHARHRRWEAQSYGYTRPGYGDGRPGYGYPPPAYGSRQGWQAPRGQGWGDDD
jgi:hypothetical protein